MTVGVHSTSCPLLGLSCDLSIHDLAAFWCARTVRALGFYLAYFFLDDKKAKVKREPPKSRTKTGVRVFQFLAKDPFSFQRKCSIIWKINVYLVSGIPFCLFLGFLCFYFFLFLSYFALFKCGEKICFSKYSGGLDYRMYDSLEILPRNQWVS